MFEIAFAWRGGRIDGSNSGFGRVLSESDEYQLARVHSGGLEGAQTRVSGGVRLKVISRLTVTRGRLKIAEVTSRVKDISAFTSTVEAFGFLLESKVLPVCLCEGWLLTPTRRTIETLISSCSNLPSTKTISYQLGISWRSSWLQAMCSNPVNINVGSYSML